MFFKIIFSCLFPCFISFLALSKVFLVLEGTLGPCLLVAPLSSRCFRCFCGVSFFPCGHLSHRSLTSSGSESWWESLSLQYTQGPGGPTLVSLMSSCDFSAASRTPVPLEFTMVDGANCEANFTFLQLLCPVVLFMKKPIWPPAIRDAIFVLH